jgi:hypothetical protein
LVVFKPDAKHPVATATVKALTCFCLSPQMAEKFMSSRACQMRSGLDLSKDIYNDKQIRARFLEELKKRNLEGWVIEIEYNDANGGNVSIYAEIKIFPF